MTLIEKNAPVPFNKLFPLCSNLNIHELLKKAARLEIPRAYITWQDYRNASTAGRTGFERWRDPSSSDEQWLQFLIQLGNQISTSIRTLHPYSISSTKIHNTLSETQIDIPTMYELSATLGAQLALLKAKESTASKQRHHELTTVLPNQMKLERVENVLRAIYLLPQRSGQSHNGREMTSYLPERDAYALHLAQNIGKIGHPLVRQLLRERV